MDGNSPDLARLQRAYWCLRRDGLAHDRALTRLAKRQGIGRKEMSGLLNGIPGFRDRARATFFNKGKAGVAQ